MLQMTRWRVVVVLSVLCLLCGIGWWLLRTPTDPTQLALGEWKEASSRTYVDVTPGEAKARGMLRGKASYEWICTDKEPYRVRFRYRQKEVLATVSFPDDDTAVVEPDVWEQMSASEQRMLADINRRSGRPEREFRLVFRRVKPGK